jgi:outer membrane protein assembly factor BamB
MRSTCVLCSARPLLWLAVAVAAASCARGVEPSFRLSSDAPTRSGLRITAAGLLFGNERGSVLCVLPDGKVRWSAELSREVAATPVAVAGTVVAVAIDGEWAGFAEGDGQVRWRQRGRPGVIAPLEADPERVYALGRDGSLSAVSPGSGGTLWALPPREGVGAQPLRLGPVLVEGALVVWLGGAGLVGLSPEDGEEKWALPLEPVEGLTGAGGHALALTARELWAVRASSGEVEWRLALPARAVGGPWVHGEQAWVGLEGGSVLEVRVGDGTLGQRLEVGGRPQAAAWLSGGRLLVASGARDGKVVVLGPKQSRPLFEARLDSPVRTPPAPLEDGFAVLAADGRLLGFRLRAPNGG